MAPAAFLEGDFHGLLDVVIILDESLAALPDDRRDDRDARVPDHQRQPAEEPEEREAQRAKPRPEPGEEQPLELRIGAGERARLDRPGVERIATGRVAGGRRRDQGDGSPGRGSSAVAQWSERTSMVQNRLRTPAQSPGAEPDRPPRVVTDDSHPAPADDHAVDPLEHRGDARRRRRPEPMAGADVQLERGRPAACASPSTGAVITTA